jgi:hypothetical protein
MGVVSSTAVSCGTMGAVGPSIRRRKAIAVRCGAVSSNAGVWCAFIFTSEARVIPGINLSSITHRGLTFSISAASRPSWRRSTGTRLPQRPPLGTHRPLPAEGRSVQTLETHNAKQHISREWVCINQWLVSAVSRKAKCPLTGLRVFRLNLVLSRAFCDRTFQPFALW